MVFEEFINSKDVDYTKSLIDLDAIKDIELLIGVPLGKELIHYILKYGYLGYKHIELYGVNSSQFLDSDMLSQTLYLHKYFPKTAKYIALENLGDGNYAVVSSDDVVYEYSSEEDSLVDTEMKLFDYIFNRFSSIDI